MTLLLLAIAWRTAPGPLRAGLVLYALLLLASGLLSTPMGGNAARLGAILGGPIAALLLWPDRRAAFALLTLPLLYWMLSSPFDDVRRAASRPVGARVLLRRAVGLHEGPAGQGRPVPDRDPVHRQPLGVRARRADRPARPRLGAPARPEGQPPVLRRRRARPHAGEVPRVARRERGPLRRARRRGGRLLRRPRGGADPVGRARPTCARSGTTRTGGSSRSPTRRRWPPARPARASPRWTPTAST